MVNTKKFSQFSNADLNDSTNKLVGIGSGINIIADKITHWTTATRPGISPPATPANGLLGYNTDLGLYEFYNSTTAQWMQLQDTTSGLNWTTVTAVSTSAVINSGYITDRTITPVTIELPLTFNIGDRVLIMGLGAAGWSLVANTGQTIKFGSFSTSVAGSINSDIQYGNIEVKGLVANTTWQVTSVFGNPTYL